MAKSDKNKIYKKNKTRVTYKLTALLIGLSIIFSLVFINILGDKKNIIAFSDNMFLVGTILFAASIIINLIKNIFAFKNRSLFTKEKDKIEKIDGETLSGNLTNEERKFLLRLELFSVIYRSFLIAGILNIFISIIFALLA